MFDTKTKIAEALGLSVDDLDNVIVELARDRKLYGALQTAINVSCCGNRLVGEDLKCPDPVRYDNEVHNDKGVRIQGTAVYADDVVIIHREQD